MYKKIEKLKQVKLIIVDTLEYNKYLTKRVLLNAVQIMVNQDNIEFNQELIIYEHNLNLSELSLNVSYLIKSAKKVAQSNSPC